MHAVDVPTRYLSDFEMVRSLKADRGDCRMQECKMLLFVTSILHAVLA